ncbi:MAG: MFS transporter, partial [Romboutsia sp.]
LLSIPFMLIIANGKVFGGTMVLAVGAGLFFRSGFMNCANPIMNSLPMEFVDKNTRPAYNSLIFVAGGVTSIIAGQFTKLFLFKLPGGYSKAYYITAVIYSLAAILLLVVYTKKYNRHGQDKTKNEAA